MITITDKYYSFINIAIILMFIFFFIIGYKRGFIRSIISLVFSIITLYLAWSFSSILAKHFPFWPVNLYALHNTPMEEAAKHLMNQFSWFIVLTIIIRFIFLFINYVLKSVKKIPVIKGIDSIGGGLFGLIETCFWIFFLCILLNTRVFANGNEIIESTYLKPINNFSSNIVSKISDEMHGVEGMKELLQGGSNLAEEQKENLENWLIDNGYSEAADTIDN